MKNLNLIVNQNEITQNGNEYLTSGGYKSIQCNFSFSEEWHNLTKTAIFVYNGVAFNETLVEDKCFVPYEAIENKGELSIGVFGTEISGENLEKRNTTDLLNVKIYEGSFIKGIQPEKPSPETWELYLEEVNKLIEEATNKIDSFTAEDIKFADGETFQEKYDNGEFAGGGSTTDENKFMKKEIYDINDNGIVDNSEKVNGHTVETDVPANAIFTDTTYDIATKTKDGLMSASDKQKLDGQVAELDEYGKVLSSQLPSYVDDVVEVTLATFPESGESGKIYVDIETNLSYRWTGSSYTVISPSIALGETSSTAYRGDRGKIAYEHSQKLHAPVNAQENVIENIKVDGVDLEIENKEININLEENLVHVSSTEPTDENRKKVWLQKNKNLFNKNDLVSGNNCTYSISGNSIVINAAGANAYVKTKKYNLLANTYTLSGTAISDDYIGLAIYVNDSYFASVSSNNLEKNFTLTEDSEVVFRFYASSSSSSTTTTATYSNIQLEVGSSASVFEDNITSAIYTKNNNDEYEKFSETVAISSHQPTNQNGLWIQKGKNLFDGNLELGGYDPYNNGKKLTASDNYRNVNPIQVESSTTYTLSIDGVAQKYIVFFYDGEGNFLSHTDVLTGTFTTPTNCKYFNFRCFAADFTSDFASLKVQLEQGSTATEYEQYKEKKIYVKNDNGVYEEFINADNVKNDYSLRETKIGTWIDGKPLYRKVVTGTFGAVTQDTESTLEIKIPNANFVLIKDLWLDRRINNSAINQGQNADVIYLGYTSVTSAECTIRIRTKQNWASNAPAYAIIEYTKTTDVATTSEE